MATDASSQGGYPGDCHSRERGRGCRGGPAWRHVAVLFLLGEKGRAARPQEVPQCLGKQSGQCLLPRRELPSAGTVDHLGDRDGAASSWTANVTTVLPWPVTDITSGSQHTVLQAAISSPLELPLQMRKKTPPNAGESRARVRLDET